MKTPVVIRDAEIEDVPLVLRFIRELADYEKLAVTATETRLRETLFGEKRYAFAMLAYHGGAPAGFAVYYFGYSTFVAQPILYVEDIFVSASSRGQGTGRALFAELIERAIRNGCGRVEWVVLDWNVDAMKFYRQLGAEEQPEWRRWALPSERMQEALERVKPLANQGVA